MSALEKIFPKIFGSRRDNIARDSPHVALLSPGDFQPSKISSGGRRADQTGGERRVRTSGSSADLRPEYAEGRFINVRVPRGLPAVRRPRGGRVKSDHAEDVREERPRYRALRLHGLGVQAGRQEQQPQQVRAPQGVRDAARHRHLHATHHLRGQAQDRPLLRPRQDPGVPRHRSWRGLRRGDSLRLEARHRDLQDQSEERQSPRQRFLLSRRRQRSGSHAEDPVLPKRQYLCQRRWGTRSRQEGYRQAMSDREHRPTIAR